MLEKRKSIRRRTLLEGRVEVEKLNGWTVECVVRNVSDVGARIALPPDVIVPCSFELGVSGGTAKPARLVWYRGGQAGVALVDDASLDDATTRSEHSEPSRRRLTGAEPSALQARIAAIAAPSRRRPRRHRLVP